jgi:hypothetical protein
MRRRFIGSSLCSTVALLCVSGCVNEPYDIENLPASRLFRDKRVVELVTAAENGDVKTIEKLAKAGVDVNARGSRDVTPLMRCIFKQNKEGCRALLENGADPNLLTKDGRSVLHLAAYEPDPFFMREALEHGGNPDLPNTGNPFSPDSTPIFYAAQNHAALTKEREGSHPENVRLLVAAGADVNHKNARGLTPLYDAAEAGQYEVMLVLLEAGAEFRSVRPFGQPLQEWLDPARLNVEPGLTGYRENWREYYTKVCDFLRSRGVQIRMPEEDGEAIEKE